MRSPQLPSAWLPPFVPRFYQLASVSVLSNMMIPLAGIVDTAFLGHLADIRPLGGVILGGILFDYLYRVLKFLRNSTNALTAQASGAGDEQGIGLALLRCGLIAGAIGGLILLLQFPIAHLGFAILSGSPAIEQSGLDYFNARIWGAPAVLLNFVLLGWLLGQEKKALVLLVSLVANGANVLLDYVMIVRWGWDSVGAGLATALSQYLALLMGIIAAATLLPWKSLPWKSLPDALNATWDPQALKGVLALKGNILVRFVALISAYAIFTNLSAALGPEVLAENGLLLQIALLSQFTVQGVGMTTQTLVGNFKGKGETGQILPLLGWAIATSLTLSLAIAAAVFCFPQEIFGLLTNHSDLSLAMGSEVPWLLPLLSVTAIAFMLEGYFIGLKQGEVLRNSSLIAFGLAFAPLALAGAYRHSNALLWAALTAYMAALALSLALALWKAQTPPPALKLSQS